MEQGDIVNQELKEIVPKQVQNLRCLVFFYIGGEDKNVVYLFQDERGIKSWAIALVRNDELVHAITLWKSKLLNLKDWSKRNQSIFRYWNWKEVRAMSPIDLFKAGVAFGLSIYALAKKGFNDDKLQA